MKRILITGVTGFVGKQLIYILNNNKVKLVLVIRNKKEIPTILNKYKNVEKIIYSKNIFTEKIEWWTKQCKGIDIIVHLAWYVEPGSYLNSLKNVDCLIGTLNLAKGAVRAGVKKFVGIGTCFEYDLSYKKLSVNTPIKPTSCYANSKASVFYALSGFLTMNLVKFAWCRIFYLYGEDEDNRRLVPFLRSQLEKGKKINLENKNYVRDFLNVKDAAKKISKIALNKKVGPINICSGKPITIKQIAERIADEYGRRDLLKFKKKTKKTFIPQHVLGVSNF